MASANPVPPPNLVLPDPLNLGPQPDFDRLEQGAQQTADELGKLRNLPAFAQGQAILQAVQQLTTQFNQQFNQLNQQSTQLNQQFNQLSQQFNQLSQQSTQQFNQLNQQFNQQFNQLNQQSTQQFNQLNQQFNQLDQTMNQGFARLQTGLVAADHNGVARVTNSHVNRPNLPLMALHDPATNAPIPGFPDTIAQLMSMQGAGIDNVLTALGLPTNGTLPQRRQRLRGQIGLMDQAA